jgi:hypothetical protein
VLHHRRHIPDRHDALVLRNARIHRRYCSPVSTGGENDRDCRAVAPRYFGFLLYPATAPMDCSDYSSSRSRI